MMSNRRNIHAESGEGLLRRRIFRWIFLLLSVLCLYEVMMHYAEPRLLPVRHIQITGDHERINVMAIKRRMITGVKGFFSTNVMALKRAILTEPFVDDVVIKRIWPDTLSVALTEVLFVASWGTEAAVNSKGKVYPVKIASEKNLPLFEGPEGQSENMLQEYTELSTILRPYNLAIAELKLNSRRSWELKLDNGIEILLGRKDVADHLASFVKIYPRLRKLHNNLDSIDLRHSNGFSVHLADQK